MLELCAWVEIILAENNAYGDTPQSNYSRNSDEYIAHVLDHLSEEEHLDPD